MFLILSSLAWLFFIAVSVATCGALAASAVMGRKFLFCWGLFLILTYALQKMPTTFPLMSETYWSVGFTAIFFSVGFLLKVWWNKQERFPTLPG